MLPGSSIELGSQCARLRPFWLSWRWRPAPKPQPPQGRWEGGYDGNGILVAARVEIGADGLVKLSAPDLTNAQGAKPEQLEQMRDRLAADLATAWDTVAPRPFDFDGTTFRKPGGVAPQMVWDKDTNQMTLELYIGANPALAGDAEAGGFFPRQSVAERVSRDRHLAGETVQWTVSSSERRELERAAG